MENSPLALFEHEKFGSLRVVERKVQPWFVAKDVCDILEMGNPRSSLALLDEDEKGVHSMDTPGGKQEMTIISEPGLYSLILRSRKPEAKAFKRWVTHEVIPSIRKVGGYLIAKPDDTPEAILARAVLHSRTLFTVISSRLFCHDDQNNGGIQRYGQTQKEYRPGNNAGDEDGYRDGRLEPDDRDHVPHARRT